MHSLSLHIRKGGFYNGFAINNIILDLTSQNSRRRHYGGTMTVNIRATEASTTAEPLDILALYRTMVTARVTNDLLKTRKTQGRFPFYLGCAGPERMPPLASPPNQNHCCP